MNACRRQDGPIDAARGAARVVDPATNAKLEVRFAPAILGWLPQVRGDDRVIALADDDDRCAPVGDASREYVGVLSRTPALVPDAYANLEDAARRAGYVPARLARTPQRTAPAGG